MKRVNVLLEVQGYDVIAFGTVTSPARVIDLDISYNGISESDYPTDPIILEEIEELVTEALVNECYNPTIEF